MRVVLVLYFVHQTHLVFIRVRTEILTEHQQCCSSQAVTVRLVPTHIIVSLCHFYNMDMVCVFHQFVMHFYFLISLRYICKGIHYTKNDEFNEPLFLCKHAHTQTQRLTHTHNHSRNRSRPVMHTQSNNTQRREKEKKTRADGAKRETDTHRTKLTALSPTIQG